MAKVSFNLNKLKTAQSGMAPEAPPAVNPAPAAPAMEGEASQQPQKFTLGSLITYIDSNPDQAMQFLSTQCAASKVNMDNGQTADSTAMFDADHWREAPAPVKAKVAAQIFQSLPPSLIAEGDMGVQNNTVVAPQKSVSIDDTVKASNDALKKLALQLASKLKPQKGFNLKTAAGLQQETYSLFDENSPSLDIGRTNQILTNRDIVERNRSWGIKPTDLFSRLGVDYDNLWQTFVMDRFYSEYQDKNGDWKGGYIERRFEVDKTDNTLNNYQLRPGERRKPYLPEYGSTEARLETARGNKVFNWKEAQSRGMVKTAQGTAYEQEKYNSGRGEDGVGLQPADLKKKVVEAGSLDKCPVCHHSILDPHADLCYDCEKQRNMFPQKFEQSVGEVPPRRPKNQQPVEAGPLARVAGGLPGLKPLKAPGAPKKQKKTQWSCPACQATNAGLQSMCQNCGAAKDGAPIRVEPGQLRPGDQPVSYVGQVQIAPAGRPIAAKTFNSLRFVTADVPKEGHDEDDKPNSDRDDEEDDGGFEGHSELVEFNQVKKPLTQNSALNPLEGINRYHKQRADSFAALCGEPDRAQM